MSDISEERDEFFDPVPPPPKQKKNRKTVRVTAILLAAVLILVAALTGWLIAYYSVDSDTRAFRWALRMAKRHYYLGIDEEKIYADAELDAHPSESKGEKLMEALEAQLDRYSCFYTPEEYDQVMREGAGQNVGIGISIYEEENDGDVLPRILLCVGNSPARNAGLAQGMYLLGFGTSEPLEEGDADALGAFIGEQEGEFLLRAGYERDGSDAKNYTVRKESYQATYCSYRDSETSFSFRGRVPVLTEDFSPIEGLNDTTAYLRLEEFSGDENGENAADEFVACLRKFRERGKKDLILDLRLNGGGYLSILQEISSHLMKDASAGNVAATAQYKSGRVVSYRAASINDYSSYFGEDSEVYLLADSNTASASECLIGVLLDYGALSYDRIYLREDENGVAKTYGKGIMQSFFMGSMGVMKLTVATVHWPVSGNCIHDRGVTVADGAHGIPADIVFTEKNDPVLAAAISAARS